MKPIKKALNNNQREIDFYHNANVIVSNNYILDFHTGKNGVNLKNIKINKIDEKLFITFISELKSSEDYDSQPIINNIPIPREKYTDISEIATITNKALIRILNFTYK